MAAINLGRNCSVNRNTGSYGSPVWTAISNVRDATLNQDATEADASSRDSGVTETEPTMQNASFEFEIKEDTADAGWIALNTSYWSSSSIDVAVLNKAANTSGANGIRAHMKVLQWNRNEQLTGIVTRNVIIKPCHPTDGNHAVQITI